MWKDSYLVGVETIDSQHRELFRMADELMHTIEKGEDPEAFQKSVAFLKDYVVFHFKEEEAYQASVGYRGIQAHKKEHRAFTQTVLDYAGRLEESGYDLRVMKDLMGTLTSWLIYHVADTDQKMVRGETDERTAPEKNASWTGLFADSFTSVLAAMAGLSCEKKEKGSGDDVYIELAVTGEKEGSAVFGFSRELALRLIEMMTFMKREEIDELVISALSELVNIAGGNAVSALAAGGIRCDIKPPRILEACKKEGAQPLFLETGAGGVSIAVSLL